MLRIEDTDVERSTRESEAAIIDDLRWLGLDWDEGPDVGGPTDPYRQSERLHLYSRTPSELLAPAGVYCFCSADAARSRRQARSRRAGPRSIPARAGASGRAGQARIAAGERPAIRFRVPDERDVVIQRRVRGEVRFTRDVIGDPVIVRADGHPAYNFAVVVDDALMEVTHVIRGEDHISNTPRQSCSTRRSGSRRPSSRTCRWCSAPITARCPSVTARRRWRSSARRATCRRRSSTTWRWIGWSPGGDDELLPSTSWRAASRSSASATAPACSTGEARWANRHYLKIADPARLASCRCRTSTRPAWNGAGRAGLDFLASAMAMASASVDRLDQVPARLALLFDYDPERASRRRRPPGRSGGRRSAVVAALAEELAAAPSLDREKFREVAKRGEGERRSKG